MKIKFNSDDDLPLSKPLKFHLMTITSDLLLEKMVNFIRRFFEINGGKENYYEKDYMKIKFNSDDDLPLNKPLKFHLMTITIRSVFEEDGKLYPQDFLDDALYGVYGRV